MHGVSLFNAIRVRYGEVPPIVVAVYRDGLNEKYFYLNSDACLVTPLDLRQKTSIENCVANSLSTQSLNANKSTNKMQIHYLMSNTIYDCDNCHDHKHIARCNTAMMS